MESCYEFAPPAKIKLHRGESDRRGVKVKCLSCYCSLWIRGILHLLVDPSESETGAVQFWKGGKVSRGATPEKMRRD